MSKKPKITRLEKKGSKQEFLPSRHALAELTGGDKLQRSMNNYAKKTPTGADGFSAPWLMQTYRR